MSVLHEPEKPQRRRPARAVSPQEIAIFAVGVLAAVMVGIAASSVLPNV